MNGRLITTILLSMSVAGCSLLPWSTGGDAASPMAAPAAVEVREAQSRNQDMSDVPRSSRPGAEELTIGGAMLGTGTGLAVGLAACTPSLFVPAVYPLCVGLVTLTGTTAGAAAGALVGAQDQSAGSSLLTPGATPEAAVGPAWW